MSLAATIHHEEEARLEPRAFAIVRWSIWVYLFFLLFEGVLRKWIVPGLAGPLLVVRDPIVMVTYGLAIAYGVFPRHGLLAALAGVCLVVSAFGFLADRFLFSVYLYGWRTDFLHVPLLFVMARVMTRRHIVQVGWWWLLISIPMALLIVKQFDGGADSILNTTAGQTGVQINTSGGKVRASGTFSFVSGVVAFCSITAAYVLYGLFRPKTYPIWLLLSGGIGMTLSIATSGSRSVFLSVGLVGVASVCCAAINPKMVLRLIFCLTILGVGWLVTKQLRIVKEGVEVMTLRFEEAEAGTGGIIDRIMESNLGSLSYVVGTPFFGHGLGIGTNAGSALATGEVTFLTSENEWGRLIEESGPLAGLLLVGWRIALTGLLAGVAVGALRRGDALSMLLFGASCTTMLQGQFGQPTMLGFAIVGAGLCWAASREDEEGEEEGEAPPTPQTLPSRQGYRLAPRKGRAAYAEMLHRNDG